MTLLLTGATGFVGRNLLLRALRENRYEKIWVPVRSREKLAEQLRGEGYAEIPGKVIPLVGSAADWNLGEGGSADHVVHAAGTLFARTREEYFTTNVEGTLELLRALKPAARVIILSSQAAAGPCRRNEKEKNESSPESPLTWYGSSKLEMEKRVAAEARSTGRSVLILRPPMIFGPRDQATLPLFKMAKKAVRFKPGFHRKWYSYISVSDLIAAIFAALDRDSAWQRPGALSETRSYFIASSEPVSDGELIATTGRSLERQGWLLRVPQSLLWVLTHFVERVPAWRAAVPSLTVDRAREIWPNRWVVSSQAFQRDFDWRPAVDLMSALRETGEWYLKTGQLTA